MDRKKDIDIDVFTDLTTSSLQLYHNIKPITLNHWKTTKEKTYVTNLNILFAGVKNNLFITKGNFFLSYFLVHILS